MSFIIVSLFYFSLPSSLLSVHYLVYFINSKD